MPLTIVRNDITKMPVDAIVNAANTGLKRGGGVCGAIFNAAGAGKLQSACNELAPIKTGDAVVTPGFDLPAKYIVHTAGPVYRDGKSDEEKQLRAAYTNSLKRALENDCESIAFPLISSGIYGYPKAEALRVATSAIKDFIADHEIDVSLVVFDKTAFAVSEELLGGVKAYVDEHYVYTSEAKYERDRRLQTKQKAFRSKGFDMKKEALFSETVSEPTGLPTDTAIDDLVKNLDEPFSSLDAGTKEEIYGWVKRSLKDMGMSSLLITHDPREAEILCDDVVMI